MTKYAKVAELIKSSTDNINSFIKAFEDIGYSIMDDDDYNDGYHIAIMEKI